MTDRRASGRLLVIAIAALVYGCAGEGCDCLADLPAPFSMAAKQRAGVQVRVTQRGLEFISDNALDLLAGQIEDTLTFPVPPDCSSDPSVCCGYPLGYCSMEFDLNDYGEGSHIDVKAVGQGGNRLGITIYPRVRTLRPMPARTYGPLGGAIDCNVEFNTRWSGTRWMSIYFEAILAEDAETKELGVTVTTGQVGGIASGDINIYGDFLCRFGSEQDAINGIAAGFRSQVPSAIEDFLCAKCDTDAACGAGASCDEDGICRSDSSGDCRQNFGLAGRHQAGDLLGPLLGQAFAKKLDVYFSAGGQAVSEAGGLSLAVTSGIEPAATADQHHCVPVVAGPAQASLTLAGELRGNTNPKTGGSYDLGAAIHVDALNRGAWAAHQAGYICLNLGTQRIEMLTTNAMLLVAPSLGVILEERDKQPMYVLVRPQTAPVISLGEGTFVENGEGPTEIDDALIKIALADLELDFYAFIDQRYARIFTVVADANIGISLDVDEDGALLPLLDDPVNALSNVNVTNVAFLAESAEDIADRIPAILGVALAGIQGELAGIELPGLAGLAIELGPDAFSSIEGKSRLAMYGNLAVAPTTTRVETELRSAAFDRAARTIRVDVGSSDGRPIEWQFRLGDGFWSPFTRKAQATIARAELAVAGSQTLSVRARAIGAPATLDRTPSRVELVSDAEIASGEGGSPINFHGQGEAGCAECSNGGVGFSMGGVLLVLAALLVAFGSRWRRRVALMLALAFAPSCSCGNGLDGESDPNDPNQVQPGPVGRWVSASAGAGRVMFAAYDRGRGDLVIGELRENGEPRYVAIDGVPLGPVTKDPKGYRGGIEADGPDVGAWASVQIAGGSVVVAYQDRERRSLRVAYERDGLYSFVDVDVPAEGTSVGMYASLAVRDGRLGIAYQAVTSSTVEGETTVSSELRYASAAAAAGPWTTEVVASAEPSPVRLDGLAGVGAFSALTLTADGPAIAYYDTALADLRLARKRADSWTDVVIDSQGDRGQHASIASRDDEIYIAYQDADADSLLVRRVVGDVIEEAELVDAGIRAGDRNHPVGASASIAVSGDDLVVSYQDSAESRLMLALRPRAGGPWTAVTAAASGAGYGIGLALDGSTPWTVTGLYEAAAGRLESTRW